MTAFRKELAEELRRSSLTGGYIGMGLARNELMTPSVKRAGLRSPLFARRMILLATDVAM